MAQVINTNSLSLITQNNINKNQSALSSSIERLSSGLRINSAKDDAAGQAIANRFTSNIKGLTQAARNANDGISVAQTTEGALSEINNNLQRIRELTVQASTGTNSDSDLDSIQDEIKSRLDEIDRVSGQTQFNGVNMLAKDGSMKIQVGANDGQTISIDLQKIDSSTLGLKGFSVSGNALKVSDAITTVPGANAGDAPVTVKFGANDTAAAAMAKTLGISDTSGLSYITYKARMVKRQEPMLFNLVMTSIRLPLMLVALLRLIPPMLLSLILRTVLPQQHRQVSLSRSRRIVLARLLAMLLFKAKITLLVQTVRMQLKTVVTLQQMKTQKSNLPMNSMLMVL